MIENTLSQKPIIGKSSRKKNFFVRLCNGDAAFPQLGQFAHQIYLDFPDFGMVKLHYSPSYGKNARRGCL